jgi:hypothetical protein
MREDMSRVIVERPRIIDSVGRKGRSRPLEDLPKQEGMRRSQRERGGYKTLNENLAPLRRFLERQVGRPWDKVYSEIAERLRVDSTVQQHVRDHLRDFVATRPRRGICAWYTRGGGSLWHQPLYVDPRDGILKRTDRLPEAKARRRKEAERSRKQAPADRVELSSGCELRRIDGIWYEITLVPLPQPEYRSFTELRKVALQRYQRNSPKIEMEVNIRRLISPAVLDLVTGRSIPVGPEIDEEAAWREYRRNYPDRRYAISKRQLPKKVLRRHRLANVQSDLGRCRE